MFCPVCKTEHIDGVTTCEDCNVTLVRNLPIDEEPSEDFIEFEAILATYNAMDIALLKSLLDAEGITYFFQGEHFSYVKQMAIPVRLMVKKDQVRKVKDILGDIHLSFFVGTQHADAKDDEND